jgi:hypothetical protein
LLALIGEQFDFGDEICGVVVSVRQKQEKVAIWTKNAANEAAQVCILKCILQTCLHIYFVVRNCVKYNHAQ